VFFPAEVIARKAFIPKLEESGMTGARNVRNAPEISKKQFKVLKNLKRKYFVQDAVDSCQNSAIHFKMDSTSL